MSRDNTPPPLTSGTARHYTSAEALHGIWGGDDMWASAVRVLNDANEITYGIKAIQDSWGTRRERETNTQAVKFIDSAINAVGESPQSMDALRRQRRLRAWTNNGNALGFKGET
jgi:hypothetical protein